MNSLQILNKLNGKALLNRENQVTQPSSQQASNHPQHKNVAEKECWVWGWGA